MSEFDAVVGNGVHDDGEDVEELLPVGRGWDGEFAAGDAPGAACLAERAACGMVVVAEGLAAKGG